jgi:triosephosphate isomerase
MKLPVIIVNLKAYKEAVGDSARRICRYAREISNEYGVDIKVAVNPLDLKSCASKYPDVVIAQHVDVPSYGAYTGHIPLTYLMDLGINASLINHSEYKIDHERVVRINRLANENGFKLVICVDSIGEMQSLNEKGASPFAYAIEPPELIGSGKAVSKYRPELLNESLRYGRSIGIPILCGAGIVSGEDVKAAILLGTNGILVASAVAKAKKPEDVLKDFAENIDV